jgi:hypothetical protein
MKRKAAAPVFKRHTMDQPQLLPPSLDELIEPGHLVRVVVVLRQREHLDGLAGVLEFGKMLGHAPLGIVVCADVGRQQHAGYWVQDCAAATQNILLACHALGLGAVWIGVYPRGAGAIGRLAPIATLGISDFVTAEFGESHREAMRCPRPMLVAQKQAVRR